MIDLVKDKMNFLSKDEVDKSQIPKEVLYLRLYVHGSDEESIANFLNINLSEVYLLKSKLEKQLKTTNWLMIIYKASKKGYLKKIDFINEEVRQETLSVLDYLYDCFDKDVNFAEIKKEISQVLNAYCFSNHFKLKYLYKDESLNILNKEELKYLESYCQIRLLVDDEYYNQKKSRSIELNIFRKLKVNGWYEILKIVCYNGLIEYPLFYNNNFKYQIGKSLKHIMNIRKTKKSRSSKENKSILFDELINIHTLIEFEYLFFRFIICLYLFYSRL